VIVGVPEMPWWLPGVVVTERHARSKTPVLGRARGLVSPRLGTSPGGKEQGGLTGKKRHREKCPIEKSHRKILPGPKPMARGMKFDGEDGRFCMRISARTDEVRSNVKAERLPQFQTNCAVRGWRQQKIITSNLSIDLFVEKKKDNRTDMIVSIVFCQQYLLSYCQPRVMRLSIILRLRTIMQQPIQMQQHMTNPERRQ
jgi:hypothetical protein